MFRFAERHLEMYFVQRARVSRVLMQEFVGCFVVSGRNRAGVAREAGRKGSRVESWNRQRALRMGTFNF